MKLKVLVVGIAMAVAAPLAMAEGFYGAFDLGQSKAKGFCDTGGANLVALGVTSLTCDDKDTAYRISLGYQINNNFSVEGSYLDAGKVAASIAGTYLATPYTASASIEDTEFQFVAIGSIPVAENFSLFGKAGVTMWDVKASAAATVAAVSAAGSVSSTGNDFLWGIGAKYDINKTIAMRGQFESRKVGDEATTGRGTVDMLSLGLVYKF